MSNYHQRSYWDRMYESNQYGKTYEWLGEGEKLLNPMLDILRTLVGTEAARTWRVPVDEDPPAEEAPVAAADPPTEDPPVDNKKDGGKKDDDKRDDDLVNVSPRVSRGRDLSSSKWPPLELRVLHPGCGNSLFGAEVQRCLSGLATSLAQEMFPEGDQFPDIRVLVENSDYSREVISHMQELLARGDLAQGRDFAARPLEKINSSFSFAQYDMTSTDFDDTVSLTQQMSSGGPGAEDAGRPLLCSRPESVHLVVEKGLADAILANPIQEGRRGRLRQFLGQVQKVLMRDGVLALYTLDGDRLSAAVDHVGDRDVDGGGGNKIQLVLERRVVVEEDRCELLVYRKRVVWPGAATGEEMGGG